MENIIDQLIDIGKRIKDSRDDYDKKLYGSLLSERSQVINTLNIYRTPVSIFKKLYYKVLHQLPTQITTIPWVYAYPPQKQNEDPDINVDGGKWLIFLPVKVIDNTWLFIKSATERGQLGIASKCATMYKNPNAKYKEKVICIYTKSLDDHEIFTLRYQLFKFGFSNLLPFKTNRSTLEGKYWIYGDRNISLYRI